MAEPDVLLEEMKNKQSSRLHTAIFTSKKTLPVAAEGDGEGEEKSLTMSSDQRGLTQALWPPQPVLLQIRPEPNLGAASLCRDGDLAQHARSCFPC